MIKIKLFSLFIFLFCHLSYNTSGQNVVKKLKVYYFLDSNCSTSNEMVSQINFIDQKFKNFISSTFVFLSRQSESQAETKILNQFSIQSNQIVFDSFQNLALRYGLSYVPVAVIVNKMDEILYRGRIVCEENLLQYEKDQNSFFCLKNAIENSIHNKKIEQNCSNPNECKIQFLNSLHEE